MEIAKNDMMMHAIHNELIRKRKEIVNKYKLLRDKIQDNKLLVDVFFNDVLVDFFSIFSVFSEHIDIFFY